MIIISQLYDLILQNPDFLSIITIVLPIFFLYKIRKSSSSDIDRTKKRAKDELFLIMKKHLIEKRGMDLETLKYAKMAIERKHDVNLLTTHLLQDFILECNSQDCGINDMSTSEIEKEIIESIKQEIKAVPYAGLPEEERRLMKGLKDSIQFNNTESIDFYLNELSTAISIRNKDYLREHQLNKWSVPLAVIGLLLTLFFGFSNFLFR